MTDESPNVLIVSIDSLRLDHCSFDDTSTETTPFLADFSGEAAVFDAAVSPSNWTLPVHCSLFTGLYPLEHGVLQKGPALGDHNTIAELAKKSGYDTQSFGRAGWLETGDILRGFEHNRTDSGFPTKHYSVPGDVPISELIRNQLSTTLSDIKNDSPTAALDGAKAISKTVYKKLRRELFRHKPIDYTSVENTMEAIQQTDGPFFHFLHLNAVHAKYRPTSPYDKMFGSHSLIARRRNINYQRELIDSKGKIYSGDYQFKSAKINVMRSLYRGCVRQTDTQLARLVSFLEQKEILDETILVILSDHGEMLGEENSFGHNFSMSDHLIRVPLIIYDPTDQLKNERWRNPVQLNDLYPTLCRMIGVKPEQTQSVDLIDGERNAAFSQYIAPKHVINRIEDQESVNEEQLPPRRQHVLWKSPKEKIIWYPDKEEFVGPGADNKKLQDQLKDHISSMEPMTVTEDTTMTEEVRANLKRLGYL